LILEPESRRGAVGGFLINYECLIFDIRIAVRELEFSGMIVETDLISKDYFHFRMNMLYAV